jgi:hypothetical protein
MTSSLRPFQEGGKWGYKDETGQVVIQSQFDAVGNFSNGLARVKIGHDVNYIDKMGQLVIQSPSNVSSRVVRVAIADQVDCINQTNPIANLSHQTKTGKLSKGLTRFKIDEKHGYKDNTGRTVIPAQFVQARQFSEGLAAVKIDYKWGYINQTGQVVIHPQFD